MLGLSRTIPFPSIPRTLLVLPSKNRSFLPFGLQSPTQKTRENLRKFAAGEENGNGNGPSKDPKEREKEEYTKNGGEDVKRDERPRLNLRWVDLLLDPDPDNILAVGLTGLLTWASVQVLWQLFLISLAILVAALKLDERAVPVWCDSK